MCMYNRGSYQLISRVCLFIRFEGLAHELQSTQRNVAVELEERKTNCQELRSTLEGKDAQLVYAEEKKKQVRYCNALNVL